MGTKGWGFPNLSSDLPDASLFPVSVNMRHASCREVTGKSRDPEGDPHLVLTEVGLLRALLACVECVSSRSHSLHPFAVSLGCFPEAFLPDGPLGLRLYSHWHHSPVVSAATSLGGKRVTEWALDVRLPCVVSRRLSFLVLLCFRARVGC